MAHFRANTTERHIGNRRIAERIARYAEQLGYSVEHNTSGISASNYLVCWRDGRSVRVRIGNHESRPSYERIYGASAIIVRPEQDALAWCAAVRALAKLAGQETPKKILAIERTDATRRLKSRLRDKEDRQARTAAYRLNRIERLRALVATAAEPTKVSKRRREWRDAQGVVAYRTPGFVWLEPGKMPTHIGDTSNVDALRALLIRLQEASDADLD